MKVDMGTHVTNDAHDIDGIRAALDAVKYNSETIVHHFGGSTQAEMSVDSKPYLLRKTSGGSTLDSIIRLFAIGSSVSVSDAIRALGPMPLERWINSNIVSRAGEQVIANMCIIPQYDMLILHDPPDSQGRSEPRRADHVMGIAASTKQIISLGVPATGRALDFGTGCGIVALLMARSATEVVATDISPRAVEFARFNTLLNQVDNVDVRLGNLFEPIAGERFDHIVSNPPFVISPNDGFMYRRGPFESDELVQYIVEHAAKYLTPNGTLRMMAQWANTPEQTWQDRWAAWLDGQPLDAIVSEHFAHPRHAYPQKWLKSDSRGHTTEDYQAAWNAWYDHLGALNIESVSTGIVALSRRDNTAGRLETFTENIDTDADTSAYFTRLFAQWKLLDTMDDEAILRARLRVPSEVDLESVSVAAEGAWKVSDIALRSQAGLVSFVRIDGPIATLVGWCDGKRSVRELSKRLAREMTANAVSLERALVPSIRRFIERGYLLLEEIDQRPLEELR